MSETEKTIRYNVRFNFSGAKSDAQKAAADLNQQSATAQQQAQANAERRARSDSRSSPRQRREPRARPDQSVNGLTGVLRSLTEALKAGQRGFGPNSILGQSLMGFGFGGNGTVGNFGRYFLGNMLSGQRFTNLLGRLGTGGGALTRGALTRVAGGAALRGLGGMVAGAGGAAIAGAGPIGLVVIAAIASIKNIMAAFDEFGRSLRQFGRAFMTGDASNAMHGLVSQTQALARIVGGPVLGALISKIVGLGHAMIDTMDSLVSAFGRWSPIVAQQQARFQIAQTMFQYRMGQILEPILSAWMTIKLKFLDAFANVAERLAHFAMFLFHGAEALGKLIGVILKLSGVTLVFDALVEVIHLVQEAYHKAALAFALGSAAILHWVAKFDPTGVAQKMAEAADDLVKSITGVGQTVSAAGAAVAKKFFGINTLTPSLVKQKDRVGSVAGLSGIQNPGDFLRGIAKQHTGNGLQPISDIIATDFPSATPWYRQMTADMALHWHQGPAPRWDPSRDSQNFNNDYKARGDKPSIFDSPDPRLYKTTAPSGMDSYHGQGRHSAGAPAPDLHTTITNNVQMQVSHDRQIWESLLQLRDKLLGDYKCSRDEAALAVSYVRGSIYARGM